ncbi:MAG: acyl carrier protein [Magnetospirillum sp.]|nr:acyl carrier protein [Magnetospirillum sp.]
MSESLQKYDNAFLETFSVDAAALAGDLAYNSIPEWDSIGHMNLMGALEDAFDIALETDDIVEFSSYSKGKEIVAKYGVVL